MRQDNKAIALRSKNTARELVIFAFCTALIFVLQIALAGLPNIEMVSLLVMLYAKTFHIKSLYIIYAFALLEGVFYGFHIWWISYLYIWTILAVVVMILHKIKLPIVWAVVAGTFGLLFGMLCAVPYLIMGGPAMALTYWVSGIPFDLIHCACNFVICLLLWNPLVKLTLKFVK